MSVAAASQLRPFFGYYGGKWRTAIKHYPAPEHATIIEPFAGSAGYSLRYPHRKVILCEIDPVLVEVWRYLIAVKPQEILAIPDIAPGGSVDDLRVPQAAKWLVGFWLNRGVVAPCQIPSKWMRSGLYPGSFWGTRVRETIASQVDSIRHWKVFYRSYADAPTHRRTATPLGSLIHRTRSAGGTTGLALGGWPTILLAPGVDRFLGRLSFARTTARPGCRFARSPTRRPPEPAGARRRSSGFPPRAEEPARRLIPADVVERLG